ncbi:MAG TPA: hypothetical protein VF242_03980 [Nitrososphaeraceae archaeon]
MRIFVVIFSIIMPIIVTTAVTTSLLLIPPQLIHSQSIIEEEENSNINVNSTDSINLSPILKFENVKTIPNEIHVGEKFSLSATVINTGAYPVTFIANICDSELYAMFDNKVGELNAPACKMVSEPVTLNAGEKAIIQRISDISGITYKALEEGKSNAKAILPYTINVSDGVSIDSHVKNTFTVTINPNSF